MRVDLALIVCGNRISEVITATLGPLPLDHLPKSKPVTPYAVFTDDTPDLAGAQSGTSRPWPVTSQRLGHNIVRSGDIPHPDVWPALSPVPRQKTRLCSSSVEMTQIDGSSTLGPGSASPSVHSPSASWPAGVWLKET